MICKPEELEGEGYSLIKKVSFNEQLPVVKCGLQAKNFFSRFYYIANIAIIIAMIVLGIYWLNNGEITFFPLVGRLLLGLLFGLLLIPLHEMLHGVTYKLMGASSVKYGAILSQFMFYAIAHRFVINRKRFSLVAMAPFLIINVLLILAVIYIPAINYKIELLAMLLLHTACCSGDFGLCAYLTKYKHLDVVMFDDAEEKQCYFFVRD